LIVITGASDGIGAAAARQLVARGQDVVLVGRSSEKTAALAAELDVPHHLADFAALSQVRALAEVLLSRYPRIDVLANNAGGMMGERRLTTDGFEATFQVNHLAPFCLTQLLLPVLIQSGAKVIQTASRAARHFSGFDLADLNNEADYSPLRAYGNAKLANILFTRELHRRYHEDGISTAAFHPGSIASNFGNDSTGVFRLLYRTPLRHLLKSPDKGAEGLLFLALGTPGVTFRSGDYYEENEPAPSSRRVQDELAEELWDRSAAMLYASGVL
jgi:NAD(P)-dependent dehydrogenase (short-subunit alcohol dehydrogenase family)